MIPHDIIEQISFNFTFRITSNNHILKPLQTQEGASDCGLFAIACAESLLVRGDDPSDLGLDQDLMHDHLIHCLENDKFTMLPCCMYPSNVCMSSERLLEVELHCECHMPEWSESYLISYLEI